MNIENKISNFFTENNLSKLNKIIIGFSGGADSLILLDLVTKIFQDKEIIVAHVNHGFSEFSNDWEHKCKEVAKKYKKEFVSKKLNPKSDISNLENWAREQRYVFFNSLMDDNSLLLTGHHMNDQAETVLMKLFRGSGIDGMTGIQPIRILEKGFLARPLLNITKNEIYDFIKSGNTLVNEWIEDPSNKDSSYDRNFIRNELIPMIESRWKNAVKNISNTSENLNKTKNVTDNYIKDKYIDALCKETKERTGFDVIKVNKLIQHSSNLQDLILKKWFNENNQYTNLNIIDQIKKTILKSKNIGSKIKKADFTIIKDYTVTKEKEECLYLIQEGFKYKFDDNNIKIGSTEYSINGLVKYDIVYRNDENSNDKIKHNGILKKIKRLQSELNIPNCLRETTPILYFDGVPIKVFGMNRR